MNFKHASFFTLLILGIFLTSCEKDENDLTPDKNEKQGMIELEVTDAPVDDPSIKSVFVTFADVQINDQSIPDFSPVSVDLSTFKNGATYVLGADSIKVGTYDKVTLILDPDECYVQDIDENQHPLNPGVTKLELSHEFDVLEDSTITLLVDFDLRKAVQRNESDSTDRYDFVPAADLLSSLRIMNKATTGQLTGECMDASTGSDLIVAYLYAKGEYDATTATEVGDETGLRFRKAISSALVEADNTYNFPYMESGEYELHFASYDKNGSTGEVEFRGMLEVNETVQEDVLNIDITSSGKTEINLSVTGLLPL